MILAIALLAAAAAAPVNPPVVALETSMGNIRIELDQAKAPVTVANFLSYVRSGHYDGTVFHRVIPNFMIQGGGMDASMKEKPTRAPIRNEAANKLRNDRGTIAMARTSDPDSATAQFFINVRNNASLDYGVNGAGYAVFGRVIGGMDVVDRIVNVSTTRKGPHQNVPATPVLIRRARLESPGKPAAETPAETEGMEGAPEADPTPRDRMDRGRTEPGQPTGRPDRREIERPQPRRPASMPRG